MKDLQLVPIEELLDELQSRFEHCLFYGMKEKLANAGVDVAEGTYRYAGNVDVVLGLAERLKFTVFNQNIMGTREEDT